MATTKKTGAGEPSVPKSVTKVGNLVADPELLFGKESKKPFCRVRMAVNTPVTPGDWAGERQTDFYDITLFNDFAENVAGSISKGHRVVATGRPETRTWTDDDGKEHKEKGIVAEAFGPDLRWAIAEVTRTPRSRSQSAEPADEGSAIADIDEDF
jgi:single-strand DNA-binding protein